jgi:hypothetical protein
MNKYSIIIILVLSVFIWNCEEIPNDTIDLETVDYSVEDISAPSLVIFSESNSITASITVNNSVTVENVWFDITTQDGSEKIGPSTIMVSDEGESRKIYTGIFQIEENLLPGTYDLSFFIEDNVNVNDENIRKVGTKQFKYQTEAENFPPELIEQVIQSNVTQGSKIIFSVEVIDPNGPDDVKEVYYNLFSPDDSLVYFDEENLISKFPMFDNGSMTDGDLIANDGIYSGLYSLDTDSKLGEWKIQINAIDERDSISNKIEYGITVTENFAPIIGNLNMPSEIAKNQQFSFNISVSDENGLNDIESVYYQLKDPNGNLIKNSQSISEFPLFDNGDTESNSDIEPNDGIYSIYLTFPSSVLSGNWDFTFNAEDKAGIISNTIKFTLTVN